MIEDKIRKDGQFASDPDFVFNALKIQGKWKHNISQKSNHFILT
jgi:hypothetical protein